MLTIVRRPAPQIPSMLIFLAHDAETKAVFRDWAARLDAPALSSVVSVSDPLQDLPTVTPTVHVIASEGLAAALKPADDARPGPDLLVVVETDRTTDATGALPAGPPLAVPLTILTVDGVDGSLALEAAAVPWAELTTGPVTFHVLPGHSGGLLSADSPVPGALTRLMRGIVNAQIDPEYVRPYPHEEVRPSCR